MKIVYRVVLISVFLTVLAAIIAYARGYRLDLKSTSVTPTGILAVNSSPKAAKIFINGEFKGVTDSNLTLSPGTYNIEVKKEGYTSWNKTILLKGELVESINTTLFPLNPSLSPLTNLGIVKAVSIDQTDKILLFSENTSEEKDGIYVFDQGKRTLSFLPPLKLLTLKNNFPADLSFADVNVSFSPDYKEALLDFSSSSYLISLEDENTQLFNTTNSKNTLLDAWETERQINIRKILETYPKEIRTVASDSFHIIAFSPDELKMLYTPKDDGITLPIAIKPRLIATNQTKEERTVTKGKMYIYDKKEDKNFLLFPTIEDESLNPLWFSDSRHIVFNETSVPNSLSTRQQNIQNKEFVSIVDYDGTNKQIIYSGPFEQSFFTISSGDKLIVLINLNPGTNALPDLYAVGIR